MGKTRRKNRSEVEHLRGENKKLKSKIRRLERELKENKKYAHFYEEALSESVNTIVPVNTCEDCGKGELELYDFVFAKFLKCNICDFRKKLDGEENKKTKS